MTTTLDKYLNLLETEKTLTEGNLMDSSLYHEITGRMDKLIEELTVEDFAKLALILAENK